METMMSKKENKWQKIAEEAESQDQAEAKDDTVKVDEEIIESADEDELTSKEATMESLDFPSRRDLENQLTAMEMKVDEYKNKMLRAQAELKNVQRRTEQEITKVYKFGIEKFVNDLLPVADSILRGLEGVQATDQHTQSMLDGMQLTHDLLIKCFEKHGVKKIAPAKGEPFDPTQHEAISTRMDSDADTNTILEVLQPGYQLNGRVLRAAMVIVAQ